MTENEITAFRLCYRFYEKWRNTTIETDRQWTDFAEDMGALAGELCNHPCPLGARLFEAVTDAINDLYKDGMVPVSAGYFGEG